MKRKRSHSKKGKKGNKKIKLLVDDQGENNFNPEENVNVTRDVEDAEEEQEEDTSGEGNSNSNSLSSSDDNNEGEVEGEENDEITPAPEPEPEPIPEPEPQPQPAEEVKVEKVDVVPVKPPTTAVYGRVKVKLKTSKPFLPPPPSETTTTTTMSNKSEGSNEKENKGDEVDGEKRSGNGGIKIVLTSSKSLSEGVRETSGGGGGSGSGKEEGEIDEGEEEEVEEGEVAGEREGEGEGELEGERVGGSRYDQQELEASLEVIKKIMKMDSSEPFNVPVDPIKLGIPDYFDVIDTPMDFGTIHSNLESGNKYMNSEDVYRDVKLIWDNCYKYNNKGDYIVDLMKRVKKNFMKYWVTSGLYTDEAGKAVGGESIHLDEATTSSQGKKIKKGKGFKLHKDDCMCAICIMRRRRQEREAREALERKAIAQVASPKTKVAKGGVLQNNKHQEILHLESPPSSYLAFSPDVHGDAEMEDREEARMQGATPQSDNEQKVEGDQLGYHDKSDRSADVLEKSHRNDHVDNEYYFQVEAKIQEESGGRTNIDLQDQPSLQPERQPIGHLQQLELENKRQRQRLLETFRDLENPMLSGLCGTLFPNNPKSVWNGANSLVRSKRLRPKSGIHEAVASFMVMYDRSACSLK